MNDLKVTDVMTRLVVALRPQETIQEAARRLLSNRISGAPVVDGARLVGVISEADLVGAFAPLMSLLRGTSPRDVHNTTVRDVMTTAVISISPGASVWEAAALIDRHGIRRLPVVAAEGVLVGVLARSDLVRAMVRSDGEITSSVRKAIEVLGEDNFLSLGIEASSGVVTIGGTADRKTTKDLAIRIATQVPGVLEVVDELDWQWDDSNIKPDRNPRYLHEVGRDPWVVGPLVKDG